MKTYKRLPPGMGVPEDVHICQEWQIRNEITFLRELRECRNIIRLREVYETDFNVQLVMSYANLGTLKSFQTNNPVMLPEDQLKSLVKQMLFAVADMH